MSIGQISVTLIIAIGVFGPGKLPMLARHLGLVIRRYQIVKQHMLRAWQEVEQSQRLTDNLRKAATGDASYQTQLDHHS